MVYFLIIAAVMILVGLLAGRGQDEEGFNIYNRRLPLPGYIVSYAATFIGAGFFITGTAYAYRFGLGLLWYFLGLIVGITVFGYFAAWMKKVTEGKNFYTLPDYFEWRFGKGPAKTLSLACILLLTGDIALQLVGGAKLLQVLGVMQYNESVLLTVTVVGVYLVTSGFRAVVWTDYVLLSTIILLTFVLAGFSVSLLAAGETELQFMAVPTGSIIGFFLFGIFGPFSISTYYQRIFAASSPVVARRGTWLSSLAILVPGAALFVIGMTARALFPSIDPDTAFLRLVHSGSKSLAVAGAVVLWAALMSTVDTLAFAGSHILSKNLFSGRLSRINVGLGIVALLSLGLVISFLLPSVTDLAILFLAGGLCIAPSMFFQWFIPWISGWAAGSSILAGLCSLAVYSLYFGISPVAIIVTFGVATVVVLGFSICSPDRGASEAALNG